MKKWSTWVFALLAASVSVAVSGQLRPDGRQTPARAAASACSHYAAVCGGIYLSTLPNCSAGPDVYDLDVPAGVHITATATSSPENPIALDVAILTPSGGEGASHLGQVDYTAAASGVHNVVVSSAQTGSYSLTIACSPIQSCSAGPNVLCLNDDRFSLTTAWRSPSGSGAGTGFELTGDTGYFWFFNQENVEVVSKVLNGCAITDAYWVFAGGLTNVEVVMTVVDTRSGLAKVYVNSGGTAFAPIQDTAAFSTCP